MHLCLTDFYSVQTPNSEIQQTVCPLVGVPAPGQHVDPSISSSSASLSSGNRYVFLLQQPSRPVPAKPPVRWGALTAHAAFCVQAHADQGER